MQIAYFDCINGAAGDMIVAALLDAGGNAEVLRRSVASLGLDGFDLQIDRVQKQGLAATRFVVKLDPTRKQPHRHLKDVATIIRRGDLPPAVADKALEVFENLAQAEATVHGTTKDKVHFHEVGAVDAIIDIVGASVLIADLGVAHVECSPIPVGSGTVEAAHGTLPIPAPATASLLKGIPIAATDEVGELTTPTGAALLKTFAKSFGAISSMVPQSIGYGAGARDGRRRPNVLRVLIGSQSEQSGDCDQIVQLETNLDHVSAEVIGHCMERLMDAGALDVFATPIQMKKWRPGVLLTVLSTVERAGELSGIIFAETGTLGVRRGLLARGKAVRRVEPVATQYGEIRMKIGMVAERVTAQPEFEDCKSAALKAGVPLIAVQQAATFAWHAQRRGT